MPDRRRPLLLWRNCVGALIGLAEIGANADDDQASSVDFAKIPSAARLLKDSA